MENTMKAIRVLFVEDDESIRFQFTRFLRRRVQEVYVAANGQDGLEMYREHLPDVVISDIRMPVMNGLELAKEIRAFHQHARLLFISAQDDDLFMEQIRALGEDNFIKKPVHLDELLARLNRFADEIVASRAS
ncbi:response regulator transcription factor [Brevibacillus dissolubilis]|uniref:response regulator transcription factor n=1 Tax=Brevibacillus dissolubilis TaxID=1844116 RepID=UPI00159B8495|nr:response regulator [Brevibacillus dissolubilis]